jgi:hypothetical protein
MSDTKRKPDLNAFVVTGTKENPFYTKIGAAWANKAGGYGLRLDALPVTGEIVLFPPKEKAESEQAE